MIFKVIRYDHSGKFMEHIGIGIVFYYFNQNPRPSCQRCDVYGDMLYGERQPRLRYLVVNSGTTQKITKPQLCESKTMQSKFNIKFPSIIFLFM
jgi:hypothetical protein